MPQPPTWSYPLFWTLGLSLIAIELLALWLVCSHQVDRAQARRMQAEVTRVAFSDCLAYVRDSTIASCARGTSPGRGLR